MTPAPAVDFLASDPARPAPGRRRQLRLVRDRPSPVVRWAGGKTKLLEEIVSRSPTDFGTYLEPFCGGAALFFRLRPRRAILSDRCAELCELYQELARSPGVVWRELCLLTAGSPRAAYYDRRAAWNEDRASWTPEARAAMFLYLNKTCYNGVWRVNRKGRMNVPVGKFGKSGAADPSYPLFADLVAASVAFRGAEIRCEDYAAAFDRAVAGDFVYVDPPYLPRSDTAKFDAYQAGRFDEAAHRLLAARVHALVARGVRVVASQADVPVAREIYRGLSMVQVTAPRSVNSRGDGRGGVTELLVLGGFAP